MLSFKNKFISKVGVPIFKCPALPFIHIYKMTNKPKKRISLSENGIGTKDDPVYLTAHRGAWADAPQNSLPAFKKSVELGYYTAECDIRLTKDNKWVVLHNDTVDSLFCQKGNIEEFTYDEVRTFTYKYGPNFWAYGDLKICSFEEYLDVFVGTNTRPQIEIKTETYDKLYTVVDAVKEKGLEKSAIVISFDLEQLKVINKLDPEIELWYLIGRITEERIAEAQAIGSNVWLSPDFDENDAESIKLALDAGVGVSFWTVNTVEKAKMLYDLGVRYIESDILCK
ncbi:MAG: hypothetical protein IJ264_03780 [Clostridia bacterium]|nr:hypothetical protein [Clostridia bacterium]